MRSLESDWVLIQYDQCSFKRGNLDTDIEGTYVKTEGETWPSVLRRGPRTYLSLMALRRK